MTTTRKGRPPRRVAVATPIDLKLSPVLAVRTVGDAAFITVALSPSDLILVGIGIDDALNADTQSHAQAPARPVVLDDGQPALVIRADNPPAGLAVGMRIDARIRFVVDSTFDLPTVSAVASDIRVRRRPMGPAPITLPVISIVSLSDADVGLPVNPHAQAKAESYLAAAWAYRERQRTTVAT